MKLIQLPIRILFPFCLTLIFCGWSNSSISSIAFGQTLNTVSGNSRVTTPKLNEQYVDVENLKLHYIDTGIGRPVVLIHGNAGSVQDYEYGTLDLMAGNYRTIAFDLPGHGSSERKENAMTIQTQASVLHNALTELGIENPILVGHSWGGSVALAYALQYPNEVDGLVLLAPAAYPDPKGQSNIAKLLNIPLLGDLVLSVVKPIASQKVLKHELEVAFYPDQVPDNYFETAKSQWLNKKQIKAFIYDEELLNQSLQELSSKYINLQMPVVIVTGDSDRMVSPKENAYLLHQVIPQSELIILRNAGHQIPEMHPEAVRQAVQKSVEDAVRFGFNVGNKS